MQYSYLFYSLFFLALLASILLLRRDLIKDALPAFIFGAVAGPVSEILYFSDYWRPESILSAGPVLLEDILFGIAIFGLSLVVYPFIMRKKLGPINAGDDRHLRTASTLVTGVVSMTLLMGVLHMNSVFATALTFIVLWAGISIRRKELFVPGLLSGLLFLGISVAFYGIFLNLLVPTEYLQDIWLLAHSSLGITILGNIPVSEIVWFFSVGCFLSIFELFVNKRQYVSLNH